jgi:dTMP kinase
MRSRGPFMEHPKFITFEGADGVGKSLQIQLLTQKLKEEGYPVNVTREPGGTALGEHLRALIFSTPELSPETQCTVFTGARAHHVQTVIRPALEQGAWVLCDRFIHSTLVYQGILGGVDLDFIESLHGHLNIDVLPGLTFILEVDTQEGYRRCHHRATEQKNSLDPHSIERYKSVQDAYTQLTFGNIVRIPQGTIQGTQTCIWTHLQSHMKTIHSTGTDR